MGKALGRVRVVLVLVATPLGVAAGAGVPAWAQGLELETVLVAGALPRPTVVTHAGDGSGRLFLVEQSGVVRIWDGGGLDPQPFLDIESRVSCCGEGGLLGLAFHPDYESNGLFFVAYTEVTPNAAGAFDLIVARYQVSADPDVADAASEVGLLRVGQPFGNHNGGNLAFGPDGLLYLGSGDGGSGGDPNDRGQSLDTLLGKLLRIDVDAADPGREYAIPADNPFAGDVPAGCPESCLSPPCGTTCDEIWAYGLRNPWRFAFDRATGDLYTGDVGQGSWEEIDFQPAASAGGENYGWRRMEGAHCFDPATNCDDGTLSLPILEYSHEVGCSVTGGPVYRGAALPRLDGVYLFGDFCAGTIWGTVPRCDGAWQARELADTQFGISTFGEDESGELYVADLFAGAVHRLRLAPGSGGPALRIDPSPIDFGQVSAGPPHSIEVLLTNENSGPEAVRVAELAVAAGGPFTLDVAGGSAPCGTPSPCLPPGASCTVELRFQSASEAWFLDALDAPANSDVRSAAVGACTAAASVALANRTVTGDETFDACSVLATGPAFTVAAGARAVLRAGERIELGDGTTIAGELVAAAGLP